MSNIVPVAVVAAAQSADETLAPRDEAAVRRALDDMGRAVYGLAREQRKALELYGAALETGATDDECRRRFREAWMARNAPSNCRNYESAIAWAANECDKASAKSAKPNAHGQRDAQSEAAYAAASQAAASARRAMGVKAETKGRAANRKAPKAETLVNEMVAPFCATADEFRQWAALLSQYMERGATQNAKRAEDRICAAILTIVKDAAADINTILAD